MTGRLTAAAVLVAAVVLALAARAGAIDIRVIPPSPRQGEIALVIVDGARGARELEGSLGDRLLQFFPHAGTHAALVGIDLDTKAGKLPWRIGIVDAAGATRRAAGHVVVRSRTFSVERLTLPRAMVDLDPETEHRADVEAAKLRALYATVTPERLWRGRFTRPLTSSSDGGGFGSRRIINGQPRMPHSGVDFSADRGTPVVASNRGRVALVAEFFFAGRLVVLDHGLGLYTLYFHLDGVDVDEGALVERGERIGAVGATGRATGPHLHWGAQLGSARVDPMTLLSLSVDD
jgi:Peptidase family M23